MHTTTRRFFRACARSILALLALAFLPLLVPSSARAASYTVTTLADSGAGSLRQAILDANATAGADMISFSVSGTITLASTLPAINDDLTINGIGQSVTVSGNNAVRVLSVNSGATLTLEQVTVTNGNEGNIGGGIYNQGTLTISNSTISGNIAGKERDFGVFGNGGGIYNEGTLIVSNTIISGNRAAGAYGKAGGIWNSGTLTVSNSTISGNSSLGLAAGGTGGGIYNQGTLIVSNSTISGNRMDSGGYGGGIGNLGMLTVSNSTISSNGTDSFGFSATDFGGGIYNQGTLSVSNSTISGNSAYLSGGGISNQGSLTVANTILSNNIAGADCANSGTITAAGINLVEDGSCNLAGALSGDPKLGPLQANGGPTPTQALLPGSPAIDAADDAICAAGPVNNADQRGIARPQGTQCDIGAFEKQVTFPFSGFFQPIDNLPTLNSVKAGSAVPVKFSLGGDQGLNIFAAGYPKSQPIACDSGAPSDDIEQTVTAGASSLSYDPTTQQYSYTWKTDKSWANTCRQLTVRLVDGTDHVANFKFK